MVYMNASDRILELEVDGRVFVPVRRQIGRARRKSRTAPQRGTSALRGSYPCFGHLPLRCPRPGCQLRIFIGTHPGHSGEHVPEILKRIDPVPPAGFHHREEDRAPRPGLGGTNEEPVFLADRSRPDRVLGLVVVYLDAATR